MKLRHFLHQLFTQNTSNDELTVNQRCDGQGHCYYHVYDPTTRKSSAFGSEQEIRMLLDQQRY